MKTPEQYEAQIMEWRDAVHNADIRTMAAKRDLHVALDEIKDLKRLIERLKDQLTKALEAVAGK
jgi:HAMP domain-containing protein